MSNCPIPNFQNVSDTLSTGGQPQPADLDWLKTNGFKTVLNISPTDTRNYLPNEGALCAEKSILYIHYPIDCSKLNQKQYQTFSGILDTFLAEGKVFVHCGMNIKSSGFAHIYRIKALGQDPSFALAELAKTPEHEPKWFDYFKTFGL